MAVQYARSPALSGWDRKLSLPTNWVRFQLTVIMKPNPARTKHCCAVSALCIGWVVFLAMPAPVMIKLQAGLLHRYQTQTLWHHVKDKQIATRLIPGSSRTHLVFEELHRQTWRCSSQTYLAQGRWMVGLKLIKATSWLCQTNALHLDIISQTLSNVLDLLPSTCLCVCCCLHLKHPLHWSLDLFANDLVFFH